MFNKKGVLITILISSMLLFVLVQNPELGLLKNKTEEIKPSPVIINIPAWQDLDAYGQGIDGFHLFENSTGSWVMVPWYNEIGYFYYMDLANAPYILNVSAGVALKLRVHTLLNLTFVGAINVSDGLNFQRHNITVSDVFDTILFEQNNLTYYGVEYIPGSDYALYKFDVEMNFLTEANAQYSIVVSYEEYY